MIMTHKNCGGVIEESKIIPPYNDEEYGVIPAHECKECLQEILGDAMIRFVPENKVDEIQIESMRFDP